MAKTRSAEYSSWPGVIAIPVLELMSEFTGFIMIAFIPACIASDLILSANLDIDP